MTKKQSTGCPQIENAIFNWYLGGDNADPYPIINAMAMMLKEEMEVILPVEPAELPEEISDAFPDDADVLHMSVQLLNDDNEPGKYWIPVFTDMENTLGGIKEEFYPFPIGSVLDNASQWPGCAGVVLNPWGNDLHMEPGFIDAVLNHKPMSHMTLITCSKSALRVDATVDMIINEEAGTADSKASERAFVLYDIEASIPAYTGKDSDLRLLASAYRNSLEQAKLRDCRSVAFPFPEGFPIQKAIQIAAMTCVSWFLENKDTIIDTYFICETEEQFNAFDSYFEADSRIPQDMLDFEMGFDAYNNQEFEQAYLLYLAAATRGNIQAMTGLGECYYYGRGTEKDKDKAIEYWSKAAEYEDVNALIAMSDLYQNGELEPDRKKAFDLLIKAYKISRTDKDINSYPDICLRLAKNYRDVLSKKKYSFLLDEAIKYFKIRIAEGIAFTEDPLEEARQMKTQIN